VEELIVFDSPGLDLKSIGHECLSGDFDLREGREWEFKTETDRDRERWEADSPDLVALTLRGEKDFSTIQATIAFGAGAGPGGEVTEPFVAAVYVLYRAMRAAEKVRLPRRYEL
jgi:hypothetical protein